MTFEPTLEPHEVTLKLWQNVGTKNSKEKMNFSEQSRKLCTGVWSRCKQKVPFPTLPRSATEARNAYTVLWFVMMLCIVICPSKPVLRCDARLRKSSYVDNPWL